MGLPYEHVNYDFGAADRLSHALSLAHDKLAGYAGYAGDPGLRAGLRSKLLGDKHSDNWQGARRAEFEREFGPEQRALRALVEEIRRMKAAVDHATEQAHAVNAHAH